MKESTARIFSFIFAVVVIVLVVLSFVNSEIVTSQYSFLMAGSCLAASFFTWNVGDGFSKFVAVLFVISGVIWLFRAVLFLAA